MFKKNYFWFSLICLLLTACHSKDSIQTIHPTAEQAQVLYSEGGTQALGKKQAPITMVEIFSYDCRYCRQDYPLIEQFAKTHPNVRIIFKPFKAFGEKTNVLAQYAALAANQQGQFLAMHHALMTTNRPLNRHTINRIARELNLNMNKFQHDMASPATEKQIDINTELMDSLNIAGIPAVIITQTHLATHPDQTDQIPQYMQVGFLSNDLLLQIRHKVEMDMPKAA